MSDRDILMRNCFLLLFLLSAPAMAQDMPVETVTARGSSLIGLWRIDTPRTEPLPRCEAKLCWFPQRTRFCRITADGDDLAIACLNFPDGHAEMDDGRIHFAWGSMFAREVLDARLVSASRFEGSSGIKLSGVFLGSAAVSTGTKLTLTPDMPDPAGKAQLLTRALDGALPGADLQLPPSVHALGAVKRLTYLGDADDVVNKQLLFFNTYQVAFANGERLCGLHQREDGTLDVLRCV